MAVDREPSLDARGPILALRDEVGKVVVGQEGTLSGLVAALLVRGHVLLEGVPGVAKTLVVKTIAAALDLEFRRLQFTPDLMPSDVIGQTILDAHSGSFSFRPGPVFTNMLLADEINRTPPKTQAALLESMEERQVTVEGVPRMLPDPFIVVATQNPIEYEGTYPLPGSAARPLPVQAASRLPDVRAGTRGGRASRRRLGPARSRRRWCHTGRECRRSRRGATRSRRHPGRSAGGRVHRAAVSRHTCHPVAQPRRVAAWRHGTPSCCESVGMALGAHVRHPRRGEGGCEADVAPSHAASAGGRARGDDCGRRARRHSRRGAGTALIADMPVPTKRLAAVALVLAGVRLLLPDAPIIPGLLVLDGLLLLVVVVDWLLAPAPGRITVERTMPVVLTIEQPGEITWHIGNPTARRVRVGFADELAPSLHASVRRATVSVPADGSAIVRTSIRPSRRGRFVPSEVVVRVYGPMGLIARQRRRWMPATLAGASAVSIEGRSRAAHRSRSSARGRTSVRAGARWRHGVRVIA